MVTFNLQLTEDMERTIDERVREGTYSSREKYLKSLIVADRQYLDREQLETLLLSRVRDGESVEMTDADFDRIRSRLKL